MCCSESTAVLKAAIQMDHGELLEHVDGRDFYEAQKSYNQKSWEKQAACIWDKQNFFFKYFILLGMLETRSPWDTVQTALRVSFLSLDFFPFAAVLDPQCKTYLGQTESSQPLSSSLCCARKNTGVLSPCWDKEQLGKIWGSDRGFGSTFRKQKAERQRGVEFQTLPAEPRAYKRLFLTSFLPRKRVSARIYHRFSVLMPWHFCMGDAALKSPPPPWRTWRIGAGCPKGAGTWTKSSKKQLWGDKKLGYVGCHRSVSNTIPHSHCQGWGSPAECDFLL